MKVLHVLNHARNGNGNVEVVIDLACEQASQGNEVILATTRCHFTDELDCVGVRLVRLGGAVSSVATLARAREISVLVRRLRPDVVHAHMVASTLAARLATVSPRTPLVATVHNSFDRQARLMGVADRVIAVSEAVGKQMRRRGIPSRKLRVVRNGAIGGGRRPVVPATQHDLPRPCLVGVAGLHARKGISDLLDAFAILRLEHPEAHLVLIGDGPERARFEAQAHALRIADRVHFLGYVRDPREYLGSADVFVHAARAEPFGLALLEARQMGCPVVAAAVGGVPEALDGGEAGLLVPPRNPAALADAVGYLLSGEANRSTWRQRAQRGLDQHTVSRMADDTFEVYHEAIRSQERRGFRPVKVPA